MKIASIGACLSSLTAAYLVGDYNCQRLNNLIVGRSDTFCDVFIRKTEQIPCLKTMEETLGIDKAEHKVLHQRLIENYPRYAGVAELSGTPTPLMMNAMFDSFDLILFDNLVDTTDKALRYVGSEFPAFTLGLPVWLASRGETFLKSCEWLPELTAEESAANWAEIVRYFRMLQPHADMVFICAPTCTSLDLPERFQRASRFYESFKANAIDLPIRIIPPVDVPHHLTRLPDDREHFDMSVYKALSGHIFFHHITAATSKTDASRGTPSDIVTSNNEHAQQAAATSDDAPLTRADDDLQTAPENKHRKYTRSETAAAVTTRSPHSLTEIISEFLGTEAANILESSGANITERWDSLSQLDLIARVEQVFDVKFAFDDVLATDNVGAIRKALRHAGIVASDEFESDTNLFESFVDRALASPSLRYGLFIKGADQRELTNGWVLAHSFAVAQHLSELARGSIVAIVMDHSEYIYTVFIGCVLSGLVPTVLPPLTRKQNRELYEQSMEILFDRIDPSAVFVFGEGAKSVDLGNRRIVNPEEIKPLPWSEVCIMASDARRHRGGSELAFLQHSSGTTSQKKGVMLSHEKVKSQIETYVKEIELASGDVIGSWLPLYHDMGLITSFIIPTCMGCPIISMDALEWVSRPLMLLDYVDSCKVSFVWLPNFAFHHILRADDGSRTWDLSHVKGIINCSEPCRTSAFRQFLERYGSMGLDASKLGVSYALAENVFAVTQTRLGAGSPEDVLINGNYLSSGRAIQGVDLEIRGSDGNALGGGETGEIFIRSNSLFDGYFKMPDLTARRLVGGWFSTGDLGFLDAGNLYVIGRTDDMFVVNGKNIVAHEIEDDLNHISSLIPGRILVFGAFDEGVGATKMRVVAESLADDTSSLASVIRDRVFSLCEVAPTEVQIVPPGTLIKSSSGKLARAQSVAHWLAGRSESANAPGGE